MTNQPMLELNNGVRIPQVGFGTFQVDEAETQRVVETALESGYRHIDTAAGYYNEAGVGAALRASGLPREDVFVTTKLRNGDQGFDAALRAFEASRKALDVDVVDLYLIHWPVPTKGLAPETWRAFEKLYAEGAVRAIGISNFLPEHVAELLSVAEVVPAVNQIEVHPSFQQPDAQRASVEAGMVVEAYAPIGQAADLDLPVVVDLAEQLGVTPAQVVLRWHLQQGRVVLPKSVTPERIATNIDLFGFELDEAQMAAVTGLDTQERMFPDPRTAEFTQMR
ncbi:aldo/keto reductase [Ornithinimicrobium humiphilum]|uniref:Diketogulonate reductase-like aldo/keto reductase n=1 Tax=Ornithinimicrobium humiphilum TaxID=125288 RepID=A0A543K7M0_9MICO|nr:aldo/keto reductase [Ornithinimicrobium humiphilum]TQM91091.1 diketogulonate reductase-like aldo/keto reductase [Ornithinimicrobium humiphilum]